MGFKLGWASHSLENTLKLRLLGSSSDLTAQTKTTWGSFESESHSAVSNSLQSHGLYSPWNSLGQNTGVGSLSLLQGIFLTQESNQGLLNCRRILYQLRYQGSPWNNGLVQNWESTSRLYIVTLFINFYAEYIMRNAGLEETQAGIKIAGRNINNLRYADDTTQMSEMKRN